jgi:hypothetical protein
VTSWVVVVPPTLPGVTEMECRGRYCDRSSPRKNPTNNANMKKNWHQLDVDDGGGGGGMSEILPWTTDKYTTINWQRRGISQ